MNRIARIGIVIVIGAALLGRVGPFWAAVIMCAGYLLLLAVRPVGTCLSCGGRKVVQKRRSFRACKRCKGTGRAYRRGAILVHRLLREHAWPSLRDRISDSVASRAEDVTGEQP